MKQQKTKVSSNYLKENKRRERAFSEFKLGNYTTAYMHGYNLFLSVFSFYKGRWKRILKCLNFADNGKRVDDMCETVCFYYMEILERCRCALQKHDLLWFFKGSPKRKGGRQYQSPPPSSLGSTGIASCHLQNKAEILFLCY